MNDLSGLEITNLVIEYSPDIVRTPGTERTQKI